MPFWTSCTQSIVKYQRICATTNLNTRHSAAKSCISLCCLLFMPSAGINAHFGGLETYSSQRNTLITFTWHTNTYMCIHIYIWYIYIGRAWLQPNKIAAVPRFPGVAWSRLLLRYWINPTRQDFAHTHTFKSTKLEICKSLRSLVAFCGAQPHYKPIQQQKQHTPFVDSCLVACLLPACCIRRSAATLTIYRQLLLFNHSCRMIY